ncbi:MAG: hypothetical protein ACSHX4_13735 [Opitutaceae bacterium]
MIKTKCPHLPAPDLEMTHRCLTELDATAEPALFYTTALRYGHTLWHKGHAGRAILAITRALYADIREDDLVLAKWPLPYAALAWMIAEHQSDDFPGNPRISFQHQATRLRGERQDLRRARAWAVWAIICKVRPQLPADHEQVFTAPEVEDIESLLQKHGHRNEAKLWKDVLNHVPATLSQ